MFVGNPGIENTTTDETTPGFSTNKYYLNKIQSTTTTKTTPGFSTNKYYLNKIQSTTTKTTPGFPSFVEMICLWKTHGLFHLC
jgi:hypothetical protein